MMHSQIYGLRLNFAIEIHQAVDHNHESNEYNVSKHRRFYILNVKEFKLHSINHLSIHFIGMIQFTLHKTANITVNIKLIDFKTEFVGLS